MQCPGQKGACLEHSSRSDERCCKDWGCAAPAPEHPAHAEANRELRGVQRQDQGRFGDEGDAGES